MRGNLSKRGLNGSKGEKGDKGDMPNIEFRINPETGELEYRYNGMLVDREYISSHDIVTKDQVNELKQLVIAFDDKYVGDKTFEEIVKAINEGKEIVGVLRKGSELIRFDFVGSTEKEITLFTTSADKHLLKITCGSDNKWGAHFDGLVTEDVLQIELVESLKDYEELSNKVTRIDKNRVNDEQYPSAKAVIQHVATETSTAKGEMEGLAKDYKRECDEKINAQNDAINQIGKRSVNNSTNISFLQGSVTTNATKTDKNTGNITALTKRMDDCEKDITKHGEDIKVFQGLESRFNGLSDDYSAFRHDMNMNMLTVLDSLNKTEAEMDQFESTYGSGMEKLESFGDVNSLTTDAKTLVGAINELYAWCRSVRTFVTILGGRENWVAENVSDNQGNVIGTRYKQKVEVENANITVKSKVDLQVTSEQLVIFYEKDIAFTIENHGGDIYVYCVGNIPENNYTLQAVVTEVA